MGGVLSSTVDSKTVCVHCEADWTSWEGEVFDINNRSCIFCLRRYTNKECNRCHKVYEDETVAFYPIAKVYKLHYETDIYMGRPPLDYLEYKYFCITCCKYIRSHSNRNINRAMGC